MTSNMVSTSSLKYKVPKFNGAMSFSLWKIIMLPCQVLQGLWKAVEENF